MKRSYTFFAALLLGCLVLITGLSKTTYAETSSVQQPFLQNLTLGATGSDVQQLQKYLNGHAAPVASSGPGSSGEETQYYGPATARAVSHFQELHADVILTPFHLTKGTGNFYTATRNFVNQTLKQNLTPLTKTSAPSPLILSGLIIKSTPKYTIGGNVSGLTDTVVLTVSNGDSLTISSDGAFVFPNAVISSKSYSVNVTSQPVG